MELLEGGLQRLIAHQGIAARHFWRRMAEIALHNMLRHTVVNHLGAQRMAKLMGLKAPELATGITDVMGVAEGIEGNNDRDRSIRPSLYTRRAGPTEWRGRKPPSGNDRDRKIRPHSVGQWSVWTVSSGADRVFTRNDHALPWLFSAVPRGCVAHHRRFGMTPSPTYECFVGIDIAAKTFVATWAVPCQTPSPPHTFDQTDAGFGDFQAQLPATVLPPQILIAMEATGSYWIRLAVTLHHAGYAVAVLNPKYVKKFAESLPRRSKTDALDAQVLLRFATERQPSRWTPPPAVYHELRQRLMARDALLEMRQQARNQQHALSQWPVVVAAVTDRFAAVVAALDEQLATLDQEISTTLRAGAWMGSATLLLSIPGIGPQAAAWLLVTTLNFTLCDSADALVSYAGLDPLQHQSGTSVWGRPHVGRGGNARLRTVLYMATVSASRYNPSIQALYTRLRERGKAVKVARCAAARKLIHIAWAVVKKGRRFDPQYAVAQRELVTTR